MDSNIPKYDLMGILNLTDNSFVATSRMGGKGIDDVLQRVAWMIENGAKYIDVGACSTAPGNELVDADTEWKRIEEPLRVLFDAFASSGVRFSIDTFRSSVIEHALSLGQDVVVNDIYAGIADPRMLDVVAANSLTYIAMDQTPDPYSFFLQWAELADKKGIGDWILDPGFGFGKTMERHWQIMNELERFKDFGRPLLSATSRKRMIYLEKGLTPLTCAKESFEAELLAVSKGADIIRTHDLDLHHEYLLEHC